MNMSETLTDRRRREVDLPRLAYVRTPRRNRAERSAPLPVATSRRLARPLRGTGLRLLRIAERLEA